LNQLQPDFQEVIRYAINGGQSMKDFVNSFKSIEDYSSYDTSEEEHQLRLINDYYKLTTNFDDNKIQKFIDAIQDSGDLETEAIDAQNYLLDYEKNRRQALEEQQRQQREAAEEAQRQQREALDEAIQKSSDVQGRRKNSIRAFLFNPIKRGSNVDTDFNRKFNAIASNPEHMVLLADLLYDYSPEKGFNFSRYESKGKNKAAKDIKKALDQKLNSTVVKGRKTPTPQPDKVTDWETILNNLDF
jgi:type II secretory pathway pseudopilin PulG